LFSGASSARSAGGDIVVFRRPRTITTDYIKRVIGLPGDRIQMKEGLLHINDKPVQRERLADFVGEDPCGSDATARVKQWQETLPNGVTYKTLDCVDNGFYDNTNVYTVPPGHFFMMGDNRDNSTDSRVLSAVGYVPAVNLVGPRAEVCFSLPKASRPGSSGVAVAVRWNRISPSCDEGRTGTLLACPTKDVRECGAPDAACVEAAPARSPGRRRPSAHGVLIVAAGDRPSRERRRRRAPQGKQPRAERVTPTSQRALRF